MKPVADICTPALLYFLVGLTAIAVDVAHFVQLHDKTYAQFLTISIKIVVIFAVTAIIHLLCHTGYVMPAIVITTVTSIYLLNQIRVALEEQRTMTPYRPVSWEETQRPPVARAMTTQHTFPVLPEAQYLSKRIQPATFLIGVEGRHEAVQHIES